MDPVQLLIKQNPFYRYADNRVAKAVAHANAYIMHYDPEALHQLRVEMKRIKAIFSAQHALNLAGGEALEWPLKIALFYKLSGKVRAAHLLKQKMSRQGWDVLFPELFKKVFKSQLKYNRLLVKEAHDFDKTLKKWGEQLVNQSAEIDLNEFELYVSKEKSRLLSMFNPAPEEAYWHDLRKECKLFSHLCEMLSVRAQSRIKEGMDMRKIERLQETLGNWNDVREQIKWIKKQYKSKKISKDAFHIVNQHLSEKLLQHRLKTLEVLR